MAYNANYLERLDPNSNSYANPISYKTPTAKNVIINLSSMGRKSIADNPNFSKSRNDFGKRQGCYQTLSPGGNPKSIKASVPFYNQPRRPDTGRTPPLTYVQNSQELNWETSSDGS